MTHHWFKQVRDLTTRLVKIPSVTNTAGETEFAWHLAKLLKTHPYFQAHPDHLRVERTTGDARERYNVFALVEGDGPRTVLLTGHYDVVAVENYGALAPWAFDPEALLPRLVAELKASGRSEADRQALADLTGGDFLPGRGALDMKSGLAAALAVLFHLADGRLPPHPRSRISLPGSVLLVATPDEEDSSHGMRAAAARLPALAREWGIEPVAAINLDATHADGDGQEGRVVFLGSVGKFLPSVYIVGRESHVGRPFDGVNAAVLTAAVTRRMEWTSAFAEQVAGAAPPPPVTLKQADLKEAYDVTTPVAAWSYYNVLTHGLSAAAVLRRTVELVREALGEAMAHLQEQARRYGAATGERIALVGHEPQVLTFAELKERALARGGSALAEEWAALAESLQQDPAVDLREASRKMTHWLWQRSGLTGPAAVVGFASLPYPPVLPTPETAGQRRLQEAVRRQSASLSRETGQPIGLRPFFPGISDMSFLAGRESAEDAAVAAANTPPWAGRRPETGTAAAARPSSAVPGAGAVPIINAGPWGRDYHRPTERVYMPYAFAVLPELIRRLALDLLGPENENPDTEPKR